MFYSKTWFFARCASVNMLKLIFSADQLSTPGFEVEWPQLSGKIMRKLFFLIPMWLKCHFVGSHRFQRNQEERLHDISYMCVLILGSGRPVRLSVLVTASYSFGGPGICYASAQMTWLIEHTGDKNQDSYASYYIHGLAVRGSAEDFLWLRASFLPDISHKMIHLMFFLSIWPNGEIVNVLL